MQFSSERTRPRGLRKDSIGSGFAPCTFAQTHNVKVLRERSTTKSGRSQALFAQSARFPSRTPARRARMIPGATEDREMRIEDL